jgi:hypothetical protein
MQMLQAERSDGFALRVQHLPSGAAEVAAAATARCLPIGE